MNMLNILRDVFFHILEIPDVPGYLRTQDLAVRPGSHGGRALPSAADVVDEVVHAGEALRERERERWDYWT